MAFQNALGKKLPKLKLNAKVQLIFFFCYQLYLYWTLAFSDIPDIHLLFFSFLFGPKSFTNRRNHFVKSKIF